MTRFACFALPLALLFAAAPALAENVKSEAEPGYSYVFQTDFVDGDDLTGDGPRIVVRGGPARVLLIRPRTSFMAELLKTTETL
jgi:hypothetical protein